jgi:hypothetical protein
MLAPPRELISDLTTGGSPIREEKGIFPSPSSDHDLADHVPSSSAEQL